MNLVIISDIHLNEWPYGGVRRLKDQQAALDQVLEYCLQWEVKDIFMAGDLFHNNNNISGQALNVAANFYNEASAKGIKIWSIAGNHDQCGYGVTSLAWVSSKHEVFNSVFGPRDVQDRKVWFIPWQHLKFDDSNIKAIYNSAKAGDVIVSHAGIQGTDVGNGYVLPDEKLKPEDITAGVQLISGHYHKPQKGENYLVPGALNQHNWGDAGQKRGFWHWRGDEFHFIESDVTKFHVLDFCSSGGLIPDHILNPLVNGTCLYLKVINFTGDVEAVRQQVRESVGLLCRGIEFGSIPTRLTAEINTFAIPVDKDEYIKKFIKSMSDVEDIGLDLYEGKYEVTSF